MQANPSPDLAAAGGFMDLRQTIEFLEREGELRRVRAEVDWDRELGALTRKVLERRGRRCCTRRSRAIAAAGARGC